MKIKKIFCNIGSVMIIFTIILFIMAIVINIAINNELDKTKLLNKIDNNVTKVKNINEIEKDGVFIIKYNKHKSDLSDLSE